MDSIVAPALLLALSLACCADLYLQEARRFGSIHLAKDGSEGYGHRDAQAETAGDSTKEQHIRERSVLIEEKRWWMKVKIKKALLIGVLTLLDALACVRLVWHVMGGVKDRVAVIESSLMVVFWVGCNTGGLMARLILIST